MKVKENPIYPGDHFEEDKITFRLGPRSQTDMWLTSGYTFEGEEVRERRQASDKTDRADAWRLLTCNPKIVYNPSVSKNTELMDPLFGYIHCILSHTMTPRGESTWVVSLRVLWALYFMKTGGNCNIVYMLCNMWEKCANVIEIKMFGEAGLLSFIRHTC